MDIAILEWINNNLHASNTLTSIFAFITNLGDVGFIWLLLSLILMMFKNTRKAGLVMIISLGVNYLMVDIFLKHVFVRTRPYFISDEIMSFLKSIGFKLPSSYSFPSGHSSSSFSVAFALFLYNKKWGTPSLVLASLIAFSRLYFGVHYPTDVLAGVMIGIIVAYLVFNIYKLICKKFNNKHGVIKINKTLYEI